MAESKNFLILFNYTKLHCSSENYSSLEEGKNTITFIIEIKLSKVLKIIHFSKKSKLS